jgi:hypothetical protein
VDQHRNAQSLRKCEKLLDAHEMGRIAQRDAGIAEVDLDAGHARKSEAALELLQRSGAERVGTADADQARRVPRSAPPRAPSALLLVSGQDALADTRASLSPAAVRLAIIPGMQNKIYESRTFTRLVQLWSGNQDLCGAARNRIEATREWTREPSEHLRSQSRLAHEAQFAFSILQHVIDNPHVHPIRIRCIHEPLRDGAIQMKYTAIRGFELSDHSFSFEPHPRGISHQRQPSQDTLHFTQGQRRVNDWAAVARNYLPEGTPSGAAMEKEQRVLVLSQGTVGLYHRCNESQSVRVCQLRVCCTVCREYFVSPAAIAVLEEDRLSPLPW